MQDNIVLVANINLLEDLMELITRLVTIGSIYGYRSTDMF